MAWLSLFGSFRRAWDERHAFIFWGLVANFMMMLPLGILLGWGRRGLSFWKVTLLAAAISLCIECAQYVTRLGYFDVDDICTNVWGAAAGCGFCRSMNELSEEIRKAGNPKWIRIFAQLLPFALFLVFFGYFLIRLRPGFGKLVLQKAVFKKTCLPVGKVLCFNQHKFLYFKPFGFRQNRVRLFL